MPLQALYTRIMFPGCDPYSSQAPRASASLEQPRESDQTSQGTCRSPRQPPVLPAARNGGEPREIPSPARSESSAASTSFFSPAASEAGYESSQEGRSRLQRAARTLGQDSSDRRSACAETQEFSGAQTDAAQTVHVPVEPACAAENRALSDSGVAVPGFPSVPFEDLSGLSMQSSGSQDVLHGEAAGSIVTSKSAYAGYLDAVASAMQSLYSPRGAQQQRRASQSSGAAAAAQGTPESSQVGVVSGEAEESRPSRQPDAVESAVCA